jgi:hypothetical protein
MELLAGLSQVMEVSPNTSTDDLDRVVGALSQARDLVREEVQRVTAEQMEEIIDKLERGGTLTPEEQGYVRFWIIGDAESYTRVENHLQAWLQEFRTLQEAVRTHEGGVESVQDLLNLRAVLEDAVRVATNIRAFQEKKERVTRFENSIQSLDKEDAPFIIEILRRQLESEEV